MGEKLLVAGLLISSASVFLVLFLNELPTKGQEERDEDARSEL